MEHHPPLNDATDQQLIGLYRNGHDEAFVHLVQRYQLELFHFLVRFVGDRSQAEDIFQEAYLQIHLSIDSFDLSRPFKPWLFTIAANKARDYLRKVKQRKVQPLSATTDGDPDSPQFVDLIDSQIALPSDQADLSETQGMVRAVIADLPEHMREILLLAYFHHVAYKEIAKALGIPLGTVKSRLHAAVAMFAQAWKARHEDSKDSEPE